MNTFSGFIYSALEWITKFAYVNVLWIIFTLAGGIILGFYPATTALYAVVRDWLKGNTDAPIASSFLSFYKKDFIKSNKLGIFITALTLLVLLNLQYIQASPALTWIHIPLFAFVLLFVLFICYVFPAFVHFDITNRRVMHHAFLLLLVNPLHTAAMALMLAAAFFLMSLLPALLFIFGGSVFAFITMWICFHMLQKVGAANAS